MISKENEFLVRLVSELLASSYKLKGHNTDYVWLDSNWFKRLRERFEYQFLRFMKRRGFYRRGFSVGRVTTELEYVFSHIGEFTRTFHLLGDEYSRNLMMELLQFRMLGPLHVKLMTNNQDYWKHCNEIDRYLTRDKPHRIGKRRLRGYRWPGVGGDIHMHTHPSGLLTQFILEQYAYKRGVTIRAQPHDIVLDLGACWGDTALYFADCVGPQGLVYSFEYSPENIEIFQENMKINPTLSESIKLITRAAWDVSGMSLGFSPTGPSTSIIESRQRMEPTEKAITLTIDDFVRENNLGRVDFIKLDVEGAELKALKGAEATLRSCKPKLAVALYHSLEDFIDIPGYLADLDLGYSFYMDHFTIHKTETMLFAQ